MELYIMVYKRAIVSVSKEISIKQFLVRVSFS
jgi:hypothetical protein